MPKFFRGCVVLVLLHSPSLHNTLKTIRANFLRYCLLLIYADFQDFWHQQAHEYQSASGSCGLCYSMSVLL